MTENSNIPSSSVLHTSWSWVSAISWNTGWLLWTLLYYVVIAIVFVITLLWQPVAFLLQPLWYLWRFIARFEVLYPSQLILQGVLLIRLPDTLHLP